jgi:hypothetical protein
VMLAELVEEYLQVHQAAPATIEKLRWLLAKATAAFGEVRLVDLRADELCAWRRTLPEGHRFEATQALRQVLIAAVAWQLLDVNPARRGVANPLRRFPEKRPFESWDEVRAVAAQLGPVTGPMVVFGAATGLRPAELVALEQRDVDRGGRGRLCAPPVRARSDQADEDAAKRPCRAATRSRARGARPATRIRRVAALSRGSRRLRRPTQLPCPRVAAGADRRPDRPDPSTL